MENEMKNKNEYKFCLAHKGSDVFFAGEFDTIEEARRELEVHVDESLDIRFAVPLVADDWLPDADGLVGMMDECAYDDGCVGDNADSNFSVSDVDEANEALSAWAEKYVSAKECFFVGDRVDAVHQEEEPSQKNPEAFDLLDLMLGAVMVVFSSALSSLVDMAHGEIDRIAHDIYCPVCDSIEKDSQSDVVGSVCDGCLSKKADG